MVAPVWLLEFKRVESLSSKRKGAICISSTLYLEQIHSDSNEFPFEYYDDLKPIMLPIVPTHGHIKVMNKDGVDDVTKIKVLSDESCFWLLSNDQVDWAVLLHLSKKWNSEPIHLFLERKQVLWMFQVEEEVEWHSRCLISSRWFHLLLLCHVFSSFSSDYNYSDHHHGSAKKNMLHMLRVDTVASLIFWSVKVRG